MGMWHGFNVVDAIVAAFLLAGLVGGVRRGLSGELARAAIAVGCVAAAVYLTRPLADFATGRWELTAREAYLAALLAVVVGAYAILNGVRVALGNLMNFQFKGRAERIGGGLCGLLRAAVVVSLLLLLLSLVPNDKLHGMVAVESAFGRRVCPAARPVYDSLSERVPELRVPESPAAPPAEAPATETGEPADVEDLEPYPLPGEAAPPNAAPADPGEPLGPVL